MSTPEFLTPVAKYHPGFLISRFSFTCPVLLYISSCLRQCYLDTRYESCQVIVGYYACCLCAAGRTPIHQVPDIILVALSMRYLVPSTKYIPYLTSG